MAIAFDNSVPDFYELTSSPFAADGSLNISCWIKLDTSTSGDKTIFQMYLNSTNGGTHVRFYTNLTSLNATAKVGVSSTTQTNSTALTSDTWTFVQMDWNAAATIGTRIGTNSLETTSHSLTMPTLDRYRVGAERTTTKKGVADANGFDGEIAEMFVTWHNGGMAAGEHNKMSHGLANGASPEFYIARAYEDMAVGASYPNYWPFLTADQVHRTCRHTGTVWGGGGGLPSTANDHPGIHHPFP
jgi:hypothetical protein